MTKQFEFAIFDTFQIKAGHRSVIYAFVLISFQITAKPVVLFCKLMFKTIIIMKSEPKSNIWNTVPSK